MIRPSGSFRQFMLYIRSIVAQMLLHFQSELALCIIGAHPPLLDDNVLRLNAFYRPARFA
jgi:hypothetical protein